MRLSAFIASIFLVALQASRIIAADTSGDTLPPCGLLCIEESTLKSSCSLTNITCICTNAELTAVITECVSQNCTIREQLTTQKYSKDSCGVKGRNRSKLIRGVGVTFGVLAVIAFGLRILARLTRSGGTFGMDDYAMMVAICLVIPLAALSVPLSTHGLGTDIWTVSFDNIEYIAYLFFWDELIYLGALPIIKISILLFYLRIFPRQGFKIYVYALIAVNVGYLISFEVISIWQCRPINGAWKRWDGTYATTCNNINLQSWMSAAFNIILDLFMFILPLPELYKLTMSPKKKLHIMLMFSVGLFVTVVSVLRLKFLVQFGNTTNLTQDYTDLGVWSTIEVPMGVICACMPAIQSLLRNRFPTLFSTTNKGTTASASAPRKLTNTIGSAGLSSKPKHPDESSFVQLVDMDSREDSKV
ncbi:hypothetical protein F5884DRAFT_442227 [Xylogone sp. PMI_703]|nr:hypothetical protein F5884DRAFT_442227 [Xylogone sp. PMI_703]